MRVKNGKFWMIVVLVGMMVTGLIGMVGCKKSEPAAPTAPAEANKPAATAPAPK
jgi:hypothetical protein